MAPHHAPSEPASPPQPSHLLLLPPHHSLSASQPDQLLPTLHSDLWGEAEQGAGQGRGGTVWGEGVPAKHCSLGGLLTLQLGVQGRVKGRVKGSLLAPFLDLSYACLVLPLKPPGFDQDFDEGRTANQSIAAASSAPPGPGQLRSQAS